MPRCPGAGVPHRCGKDCSGPISRVGCGEVGCVSRVIIPSECIGGILGVGGSAIRALQRFTGCKIDVEVWPDESAATACVSSVAPGRASNAGAAMRVYCASLLSTMVVQRCTWQRAARSLPPVSVASADHACVAPCHQQSCSSESSRSLTGATRCLPQRSPGRSARRATKSEPAWGTLCGFGFWAPSCWGRAYARKQQASRATRRRKTQKTQRAPQPQRPKARAEGFNQLWAEQQRSNYRAGCIPFDSPLRVGTDEAGKSRRRSGPEAPTQPLPSNMLPLESGDLAWLLFCLEHGLQETGGEVQCTWRPIDQFSLEKTSTKSASAAGFLS